MTYIGVDIGGTNITALCLEDEKVISRSRAATRPDRSAEEIVQTIVETIGKVGGRDARAVGIGVPGILDVDEGRIISINNIPVFNDFKLKAVLEKELGIPVHINNDANCFALSEAYFGAGKGYANIVGITLGTGVGGGIVANRKVYSGNLGAAGEFGCVSYKGGMFEAYGGSKFFERECGRTGKELFELAEQNDPFALDAFMKYGEHIAWMLDKIIFFIAPEAIVIGGSIGQAFKYFKPAIDRMLEEFPIPVIAAHVKVLPASMEESGVYGAVALGMSFSE